MPLGNPLSRLATNNKKSTLPRSKRALDSHSIVSYRSSNGQESDTSHTHRSTRRLLLRPKCSSIVSDREGRRATITHERNYYFSPPPSSFLFECLSRKKRKGTRGTRIEHRVSRHRRLLPLLFERRGERVAFVGNPFEPCRSISINRRSRDGQFLEYYYVALEEK